MKKADVTKAISVESAAAKKVLAGEGSKSFKMKALFELGVEIKDIAVAMQVRYNFVYNVVSNYANMNGIKTVTNKKIGKKDQIIQLFLQGKSNKEISIELQTNYNYVFNTLKQYKAEQAKQAAETQTIPQEKAE